MHDGAAANAAAPIRRKMEGGPPKRKDPSGGTTGRVKAIWALGVDGRSRRIQPMGRDYRSHTELVAATLPDVQSRRRFF
jgi:hypothetical protein